jgi:flagellar basal body-associated protein FliL
MTSEDEFCIFLLAVITIWTLAMFVGFAWILFKEGLETDEAVSSSTEYGAASIGDDHVWGPANASTSPVEPQSQVAEA